MPPHSWLALSVAEPARAAGACMPALGELSFAQGALPKLLAPAPAGPQAAVVQAAPAVAVAPAAF